MKNKYNFFIFFKRRKKEKSAYVPSLQFLSGFSILEIIIVVMILAVTTGLVVPKFKNIFNSVQQRAVAEDIMYLMRYAQDRSIVKGCIVRLRFDEMCLKYWLEHQVFNISGNQFVYEKLSGRLAKVILIPESIRVETAQFYINFYPDGTMDKQRIYICNDQNCYTVSSQEQESIVRIFDHRID